MGPGPKSRAMLRPFRQRPRQPRFDARWNRRRRNRRIWQRWRGWLGLALILAAWILAERWWIPQPENWEPVTPAFMLCGVGHDPCVYDGDTVMIGFGPKGRRIRLIGYDAPEIDGTCDAERAKAGTARDALLQWLNRGPFEWDGGADPPRDQYGRELRSARRGDDLLAAHMLEQKLASGSGWGASPIDWCAQ